MTAHIALIKGDDIGGDMGIRAVTKAIAESYQNLPAGL